MSKYIKLEDAINKMDEWFCEPYTPTELLSDLPTIEVDEDCISREWLKGQIEEVEYKNMWHMTETDKFVSWENIENAPRAVPSRAEGEWVKQGLSPYEGIRRCSLCGNVYNITEDFNYCPNCGAKMEGVE